MERKLLPLLLIGGGLALVLLMRRRAPAAPPEVPPEMPPELLYKPIRPQPDLPQQRPKKQQQYLFNIGIPFGRLVCSPEELSKAMTKKFWATLKCYRFPGW